MNLRDLEAALGYYHDEIQRGRRLSDEESRLYVSAREALHGMRDLDSLRKMGSPLRERRYRVRVADGKLSTWMRKAQCGDDDLDLNEDADEEMLGRAEIEDEIRRCQETMAESQDSDHARLIADKLRRLYAALSLVLNAERKVKRSDIEG